MVKWAVSKENPEGTSKPEDSVETIRETSATQKLQQDYEAAGSLRKLQEMYGIDRHKLRDMLAAAGIPIKTRAQVIKRSWEQEERREVQVEKITASWQDPEIRDRHLAHWDEPGERERQRQVWLERIEAARHKHGEFPPAERELHSALMKARISFTANATFEGLPFIVDALITHHGIIVEADGASHNMGNEPEKDAEREGILRGTGRQLIRVQYRELADGRADRFVTSLNLEPEENPEFIIRRHIDALHELIRRGQFRR